MLSVAHPASAHEALQLRDAGQGVAAFVGGGTALQLGWRSGAPEPMLIDVSGLAQGCALQRCGPAPAVSLYEKVGLCAAFSPPRCRGATCVAAPATAAWCGRSTSCS